MQNLEKEFGKHYLVELTDCVQSKLEYVKDVKSVFLRAAEKSGASIISHNFHQFDPVGVTGIIFIKESHFSIHTWPEEKYAAFDVFTCGDMKPESAIEEMRIGLGAKGVIKKIILRGF